MSVAGFDMPRMLLWASMLSSHFSPPKFSTVMLRTVPLSRQCGATPVQKERDSWKTWTATSCHVSEHVGFQPTVRVSGLYQCWSWHVCLKNTRDTCHELEHSYHIHQGWSVACRNFERHKSYRRCVSQHECWTCMLSDYLTPGKEMENRVLECVKQHVWFISNDLFILNFLPVRVWTDFLEQWNGGFVSLCKCYNWKKKDSWGYFKWNINTNVA